MNTFIQRIRRLLAVPVIVSALGLTHAAPDTGTESGDAARMIVAYVANTSPQEIAAIEKKFDLRLVKILTNSQLRVYQPSPGQSVAETIRLLEKEPTVRYAEVDGQVSIQPIK